MSVPILPPDPTDALYPLDWAADGDLQPPTALQPRGFEPGVPLAAQHLGWVLRHIYYLLSVLFGGTLAERKVSVWPGLLHWVPILEPPFALNPLPSGGQTFAQLLAVGHGWAAAPQGGFVVDSPSQAQIIAGADTKAQSGRATVVNAFPGGLVETVRVRIGDAAKLKSFTFWIRLSGSDGLFRTWLLSSAEGDELVANAWNELTFVDNGLAFESDDLNVPGPVTFEVVQWQAEQDDDDAGTPALLVEFEEIEVTFGT